MRITIYDNGEVFVPDKLIGFVGETERTIDFVFSTITGADGYKLRVTYSDELIYDIPIDNKVAVIEPSVLREAGKIKAQWIAYAADGSTYTLIAKSEVFDLIIGESIGDDAVPIPTYEQIMNAAEELIEEGMTKEQIITAIQQIVETGEVQDLDTGFVTTLKEQNHGVGFKIWLGTTAEFEALETIDPDTLYIKTDDDSADLVNTAIAMYSSISGKLNIIGNMPATITLSEIFNGYTGYSLYTVYGNSDTSIYPVIVPAPSSSSNVAIVRFEKSGGTGLFTFCYNDEMYVKAAYSSTGGITFSNWEKLGAGDDTGWQTLPLNANVATTVSSATVPKYRKMGKQVFIEGTIQFSYNATYDMSTEFAVIPEGYRPAKYIDLPSHITGSAFPQTSSNITIGTNGKMLIDTIYDLTHSRNITTGSGYAYIHVNYLVD